MSPVVQQNIWAVFQGKSYAITKFKAIRWDAFWVLGYWKSNLWNSGVSSLFHCCWSGEEIQVAGKRWFGLTTWVSSPPGFIVWFNNCYLKLFLFGVFVTWNKYVWACSSCSLRSAVVVFSQKGTTPLGMLKLMGSCFFEVNFTPDALSSSGEERCLLLVQSSVAVEKSRGKMLAKEPRLDVLILLSNIGCQTKFCCCLFAQMWVCVRWKLVWWNDMCR